MELLVLLAHAGYGALGSLFLNGSKYLKDIKKEDFDIVKFAKSLSLGAVVGFVAPFIGVDSTAIVSTPIYGYIAVGIENVWKAIFRRKSTLRRTLGA